MRKDNFLKEFQKIEFDEVSVFLKDLGNGKMKYSLIFTYNNEIRKICEISSKKFLEEFMDNIGYKLNNKKIIKIKNSKIDDVLSFAEIITKDNMTILLMSEIGLNNEYFSEVIEYVGNKNSSFVKEEFEKNIVDNKIDTFVLKETKEDDYIEINENKFQYMISTMNASRRKEIENICIMLADFVNKYKGELSDVNRQYMSDTNECFKVEITLGKERLKFNNYNSKIDKEDDIKKIIITGKELISSLEPKIEEIENVIRKNKKLVLEEK